MSLALQIVLFLLLKTSTPLAEMEVSTRRSSIIGGEECQVTKYPYIVTILGDGLCGGSMITVKWVLTAAHCLSNPKYMKVRSGFTSQKKFIQFRNAKTVIHHSKYPLEVNIDLETELRYDIGLILLEKPFRRSPFLGLVTLPKLGFTDGCQQGKVLGIGLQDWPIDNVQQQTFFQRKLMCVDLPIVSVKTCSLTFPRSVLDYSIICTMAVDNKDACSGDSGGPLLCNEVIVGIVSAGKGCAITNYSAIYTRVEPYLNFIDEVMETYDNGSGKVEEVYSLIILSVVLQSFIFTSMS